MSIGIPAPAGQPSGTTTTGTIPPFFGSSGGAQTPASDPTSGATTLIPLNVDLSGIGMAPAEQAMPVTVGGVQTTISNQLARLGSENSDQVFMVQQALYHAGLLGEAPTGNLDTKTYKAYLDLLREANRQNVDLNKALATLTDQTDRQGGPSAKAAASPRILGLGKYPIELTSPIEVAAVVNATAQQLLGMDATSDQIKAITDSLHSQELTAKMSEFDQFVNQQEAFYESQHGGVVSAAAGAGGVSPVTGLAAVAPAAGPVNVGQTPAPGTPSPLSENTLPNMPLATQGSAPPTSSTPPASQASLPANAITLSDGTVLIPPTQQVLNAAPSASALAAQALRGTPQYTAYNALQAYDALASLVKGGGR